MVGDFKGYVRPIRVCSEAVPRADAGGIRAKGVIIIRGAIFPFVGHGVAVRVNSVGLEGHIRLAAHHIVPVDGRNANRRIRGRVGYFKGNGRPRGMITHTVPCAHTNHVASHGEIVVTPAHPFQRDLIPVRVCGGCRKLDEHLAAAARCGDGGAALWGVGRLVHHANLPGFREHPPGVRVRNAGGNAICAKSGE